MPRSVSRSMVGKWMVVGCFFIFEKTIKQIRSDVRRQMPDKVFHLGRLAAYSRLVL